MSRRKRGKRTSAADEAKPEAPASPALRDRARACWDAFFRSRWGPPAALAALVVALYARSIDDPLIYWDDNLYILEDARIQELSPGNVWRILTTSYAANYHPLTTVTFAVDRAIWGDRLAGFHLTQLAFYAAAVVLLFHVFREVLKSAPAAFAGAAIYAAHTIHVESVAWLASRKDVVCLVFYAAAMLAYFRYAREKEKPWRYYALFAALAAAAMSAKGYAAVLPAVLLAYDWCLARRLGLRQVLDKLPLFALGGFLTVVMIRAQEKDAAPLGEIATGHRLVAQLKIYLVYVARTILPVELSIDYRHVVRSDWLGPWAAVLGACLIVAAVTAFFLLRKRAPAVAWGIAIWFGQLATVMSTFFTLRQWMTDRYLFFPTVGSTLAVTALGLRLYRSETVPKLRRAALPVAAAGVVVLYSTLTVLRLGDWRSELTIWSDAVRKQQGMPGSGPLELMELQGPLLFRTEVAPEDDLEGRGFWQGVLQALRDRGVALSARITVTPKEAGRLWRICDLDKDQAYEAERTDGSLTVYRCEPQTFSELGALLRVLEAYKREGRLTEARKLREAIGDVPADLARGHEIQLARHDIEAGRYDEAIRRLTPVAERGKFSARRAWVWLGEAHRLKGEPEKAREAYLKSLELTGEVGRSAGTVMVEIGNLDFAAGNHEKAAEWYASARDRVGPLNPRADFYLGLAYERMGRLEEARELCEGTLALEGKVPANVPFNFAEVYLELGVIARKLGRTEEAVRRYEQALGKGLDEARVKAVRRELNFLRRKLGSERKTPP